MGCDSYYAENRIFMFSESNEEIGCLCTFPHNYETECHIDKGTILSLAVLGAAVVLAHEHQIRGESSLPECLPSWIMEELERQILKED